MSNPKDPKGKTKKEIEQDGLAGFEDFIQSHNIHIHKGVNYDKSDEGKIQSFLEANYYRLTKVSQLFQSKLNMLEKFDQSPQILRNLEKENIEFRERIVELYLDKESPLNRSVSAIFDSHFREIK